MGGKTVAQHHSSEAARLRLETNVSFLPLCCHRSRLLGLDPVELSLVGETDRCVWWSEEVQLLRILTVHK